VRVTDRASERIGGVGGWIARQREQALHHVLDLLFLGVAVADHRLLHLERSVLGDRQAGENRGADRGAARLPEGERRLRVDVDEHLLHRHLDRPVLRDDLAQPIEDRFQPRGRFTGARFDAAARDVEELGTVFLDDAEAGDAQPGIDAENSQSSTAVV
jgi:hypothetical protein